MGILSGGFVFHLYDIVTLNWYRRPMTGRGMFSRVKGYRFAKRGGVNRPNTIIDV